MQITRVELDEFSRHPVSSDARTLEGMHSRYFGLIEQTHRNPPELHGHVVTLEGKIVVPELRPDMEAGRR